MKLYVLQAVYKDGLLNGYNIILLYIYHIYVMVYIRDFNKCHNTGDFNTTRTCGL